MDKEKIAGLEKLLDRELTAGEIDRIHRIKDTLGIADNDALWDIIIAMEYQRSFYEEIPEKISAATTNILQQLASAAEKETTLAQSRLAASVVAQAQKLAIKINVITWGYLGGFTLAALLLYGSLLLWAGYSIGSGQTQPPALLLRMPVGTVISALAVAGGILLGVVAGKEFSERQSGWKKRMLAALVCLLSGGFVFSFTVF